MPQRGQNQPYRPCPADFREQYLRFGWDKQILEHYRCNWRCIARWIEMCGGEDLRQARSKVTGIPTNPRRRSKASRYVMGRTLTPRGER